MLDMWRLMLDVKRFCAGMGMRFVKVGSVG